MTIESSPSRRSSDASAPSSTPSSTTSRSPSSAGSTPPSSVPGTPQLPAFDAGASLSDKWLDAMNLGPSERATLPPLLGVPRSPLGERQSTPPLPVPVQSTLFLPREVMPGAYAPQAAASGPASSPSTKLAAELLAHDRTVHLREPLQAGQFDLHGLGWEKIYKPLGHVTVDIKPETRTSVHVLLAPERQAIGLPQLMLASVALMAANLVVLMLRLLGARGAGQAGTAASKLGAEQVNVEQVALRFSQPVHAYPAGWNASLLRVEFDGATVNNKGEIVPEGRLRLFNFIPIPGVGLAKSLLPQLNVEGDALARDGLFKLTAPKVKKDKKAKVPKAEAPGGGLAAFLQDILPDTVHMRASGPRGNTPITFPLTLSALGSNKEVLVEILPHGAQWQLELDTQTRGAPDARLVASVTATLHNGPDHQAQMQLALGATSAPKRWPLGTPVPGLAAAQKPAEMGDSIAAPTSKLGKLLDGLHKGPELEAHLVLGTRLPGEQTFINLLGDTHLGRSQLDATHTRYRVVQGAPSAERAEKLAQALGIALPVLKDLGERISGFEAQLTLAHPAR